MSLEKYKFIYFFLQGAIVGVGVVVFQAWFSLATLAQGQTLNSFFTVKTALTQAYKAQAQSKVQGSNFFSFYLRLR